MFQIKSLIVKYSLPDRQLHRRRRRLQPASTKGVCLVPPVHAPQPALRAQAVPLELQVRTLEKETLGLLLKNESRNLYRVIVLE